MTRTLDQQKEALAREAEGKEKVGMLAGLGQPESTAVEDLEPVVEDSEPAASPESTVHESILQHTLPEVQKPTTPSDHELESSMNTMEPSSSGLIHTSKPRKRDWFKTTMRKVIPVSITNRLTLRRYSKDTRVHVGEIFGGSSLPSPGGNKKAPGADQASRQGKNRGTQKFSRRARRNRRPKGLKRDFNLEVLPQDETEATTLPCEPILETLSRLLSTVEPIDDDDRSLKATSFLANIKAHEEDPGAKLLLSLDKIEPTIKVSGHVELILLSHLAKLRKGGQYVYRYLGLSKPPCLVCEIALLRKQGFSVLMRQGHTYAYVSSIPIGTSPLEQLVVFEDIRIIAKESIQDVYMSKRCDSRDSH
ncbi:hypothetical protein EYR41_002728 [Orbilia oligospora]|uniref:Uncharacterized protein n=1 Tax=Orbilia oligospora TaxID=2813651 RepID=A0A8H2E179_ORBOL|nr:hypothetical protein EYR41_002728 [Orbilia oligospora]